jgi:MFS family permease
MPAPLRPESPSSPVKETAAQWLGLNRATVGVLVAIFCMGLSEEVWASFLALHLADKTSVLEAAKFMGWIGFAQAVLEGFGYLIGGSLAHRLGARWALAASVLPPAVGFTVMLTSSSPWGIAIGAVLMTSWDALSVPATFDVVGSEVPKNRRTIAFALQSVQKRLPKIIGPAVGAAVFVSFGYWSNIVLAFALLGCSVLVQLMLTHRMRPKAEPAHVPYASIVSQMPPELRRLLTAEIFIRWGDWFVRSFSALYVFQLLTGELAWLPPAAKAAVGMLIVITNLTSLATYIPVAKWVDRSPSPRPFIGLTFFLFAIFPLCLVLLPRAALWAGLPVMAGLVLTYALNGLRELGEPARKALIANGFAPEVRARGVGLYWGLRSFAYCPAPLLAAYLWGAIGPELTFLIGGCLGLAGTAWFALSGRALRARPEA